MKTKVFKFLGAAMIAAFAQNANAQWTWASPIVRLTTATDNVGLGVATPAYKLDVNGDVNIRLGNSYRIGGNIMLRTDALDAVYVGNSAGSLNTGDFNVFVGKSSGAKNTTGEWNTVVGNAAMFENITGNDNTVMGAAAGRYIKQGNNTAIGSNALHNNSGGYSNTAVGSYAGGGGGSGTETGYYNTFIGTAAGVQNKDGHDNVYVGNASGSTSGVTDKYGNAFVGSNTKIEWGNENTALGFNAKGTGSRINLLGYATTTTGILQNATAIGALTNVATDNTLVLGDFNQNTTTVIGSNSSSGGSYLLEVNGDTYTPSGLWTASDANFKKNIKTYSNAMEVINKLNPVSYYYKDDVYFDHKDKDGKQVKRNFAKEEQIGFLAQDLEKVLPNMVRTHKDGTKAVNYNQLFGVLTQGVKEQSATTAENKNEIATLKEENNKLATLINELAISNKELKSRLDAMEQKAGNSNTVTKKEIPADLKGKIEQIAPNPFSENVVVNYFVPQTATKANMVLRSDKATQSVSFDINNKGNNSITLSGANLLTGLYLCELYVDGQLVDTQKIMLVK